MEQKDCLKLFICYSHIDEKHVDKFIQFISTLRNNGIIKEYYDRKVIAGETFQDTIFNNLENADIICLMISVNFLSSKPCMVEKEKALDLRKKKGITVVPIIISDCPWKDYTELSKILALPTDGTPILNFHNEDSGWQNVYEGLKCVIEKEKSIKQLQISDTFLTFLSSADILSEANTQKNQVFLEDIFVYPELEKYDISIEYEKKIKSEELIKDFTEYSKILIAGEDQSGKSTLCKKMFLDLRKMNFIPIYVIDKVDHYKGIIDNKIRTAFQEQYVGCSYEEIDIERIVPIIDDFHFAKNRGKHIEDLKAYNYQIIIVDDLFSLNIKNEQLLKTYHHFKIKQFGPSLRNDLLVKWYSLSDNGQTLNNDNKDYKTIDTATHLIDHTLGKALSSGIIPSYPFFILSIITTYDTLEKPLDQEITNQGYCYQALIYCLLKKNGVKNDDYDTYLNFLTEIAYYFYSEKKNVLSAEDLKHYVNQYQEKFNLSTDEDTLIENLQKIKIFHLDSFNNYSFSYQYLYYFFVAKHLAENLEAKQDIVKIIINKLHKNENAYIAIFLSHHSKNINILDSILINARSFYQRYKPATLHKHEISFFEDKLDEIVQAVFPSRTKSTELTRKEELEKKDLIEESENENNENENLSDEDDDEYSREFRRSIKTVEVMGRIITNRAGSIEKDKLEEVFEEGINVYLRFLSMFFEIIKQESNQKFIVESIKNHINKINKEKSSELNQNQLEKIAIRLFWNLNFFFVYSFINKAIDSMGSDKLLKITEKVCNRVNSPATFLINHGILMWFGKNLQVDTIINHFNEKDFSEIAKRIMRFNIINHCSMHYVAYNDKQKLEVKLNISAVKLLSVNKKGS